MPYLRFGYCCQCGDCCNIHILPPGWIVNPFIKVDKYGYCKQYDKKTKKCMIHRFKPEVCIKFPSHSDEIIPFSNCTYYFEEIKTTP